MWHCIEDESDQACARPCPPPTQDGATINNPNQPNTKSKVPLTTNTRYQSRADSVHTMPKEKLDFTVIGNSNARGLAGILRNNGYTASGTTLGGANIRAIDLFIRTRSPTAIDGKCVFIQALDVDLKNCGSPAQIYKDIDNLIEGAEEAFPTAHIILSGPTKPKAQQEQNINNQFTSYIRHKLSGKPRMCLLDNGTLSLRDSIHLHQGLNRPCVIGLVSSPSQKWYRTFGIHQFPIKVPSWNIHGLGNKLELDMNLS